MNFLSPTQINDQTNEGHKDMNRYRVYKETVRGI